MKYIIWGIGERLEKNIKSIHLEDVECFIDRRAEAFPDGYNGKTVMLPDKLDDCGVDAIVVSSSKYRTEIIRELVFRLGVSPGKIMMLDDIIPENEKANVIAKKEKLREFTAHYDRDSYRRIFQSADKYYLSYDKVKSDIFDDSDRGISIYVVSHKDYREVDSTLYKTIWVGGANTLKLPGLRDDAGDNISDKNALINECTALYWIWRNDRDSEYIGLNHYRRFFDSPLEPGFPLRASEIRCIMRDCDVVVSKAAVLDKTVKHKLKDQICNEAFEAGYSAISDIFEGRSNEERACFERFVAGNVIYPRQMFVMKRELLDEYCSWLFPIVLEMIDRVEIKDDWDMYSKRVIGFWAERMLTVWLLYTGYRIEELPVIVTDDGVPYGLEKEKEQAK